MKNKNLYRMKNGIKKVIRHKYLSGVLLGYLLIVAVLNGIAKNFIRDLRVPFSSNLFLIISTLFFIEVAIIGLALILIFLGKPKGSKKIEKIFKEIGLSDAYGETPILISKKKIENLCILELYSQRIPISMYEKNKDKIETLLNIKIISIEYGKDSQHVLIRNISSTNELPELIRWDDNLLSQEDFVLKLGKSCFGDAKFNLSLFPHVLIGGGTGSGKSNLLKLLLLQCIKKNSLVILADFKGGLDYSNSWFDKCTLIIDSQELLNKLLEIHNIMEQRRDMFINAGTPNIEEYNKKTNSNLNRIIVACDEIAEILDKTGASKETKKLIDEIESELSTIARLGRAFGIHLMLATQRPDADIVKGQLKINLGMRICGRADKILSQIVLDNSDAAEQISQYDQGLFVTNTHVLFKAYYVIDDDLKRGVKCNE